MATGTIATAAREYANRPVDERYGSVNALVTAAAEDKRLSAERTYNLKDLRVLPAHTLDTGAILVHRADAPATRNEANTLLLVSPRGQAGFSHWSFGQLCGMFGAPASYLRDLPAALAADCLNHGITASPVGTAATLLVRAPNGRPEPTIRACTSDSYGRVWDSELYSAVVKQIVERDPCWTTPPTWSGEPSGAYRGDRDSFLILTNGGSIVTDPSVGQSTLRGQNAGPNGDATEVMYRGILIHNSEVGASSVQIESILYRYICGNHMLWGAVIDKSFRRRHVGTRALRDTIREIGRLAWNWTNRTESTDRAIVQALIDHELASTREAVIDELQALGATKDQATQAYVTCEQHENVSPRSYWGVAQGLTRVSQASPYQDGRYELDRLASVVMARGAKLVKV